MSDPLQPLEAAIAALQAQRAVLGEAVVDAALAPLLAQRAAISGQAGTEPPQQQLRQVSVLFADIVGSTSLSQHFDPEDVHAIMDGALAAFSADQAAEDDVERAVHAGLAIIGEGARVALARGDAAAALAGVSESADRFLGGEPAAGNLPTLADVLEVLQAVDDPRRAGVLALAHAELLRMADAIADPQLRSVFWGTSRARLGVLRAWRLHEAQAHRQADIDTA